MKLAPLVLAAWFASSPYAHAQDPEFGGQCATAMSEGISVTTNCSILWLSSDDKIYCFVNEDAKRKFLENPQASVQRAQASWQDRENLKRLIRRE